MATRGGRGGFGAGRGRGGGGPTVPWAYDPDIKPHYLSTDLFPEYHLPVQDLVTAEERTVYNRFREFRENVHSGPFYTVLTKKRGLEDPFEDAMTYSTRYKKAKRKVPRLDGRPYVFEFFPSELYTTLDPTHDPTADAASKAKAQKKRLMITSLNTNGDAFSEDDVEDGGEGEDAGGAGGKKKKAGMLNSLLNDEDDEVPADDDDAEEGEGDGEEDRETDFEDDIEGDYNAEQYFEDEENEGDYGDGDGGGGEDFY